MTIQSSLTPKTAEILVVDDTVENLKLLSEILTDAGYLVRTTERPLLALRSALAHPPALILLDVRMPEMSGFELCRRLKQDERTQDVPVIFVSALQEVDDKVQGFEIGGVDFVSKPFQESEVLARVNTHLQLRTMHLHLADLVSERTAELNEANEALQSELTERKRAEALLAQSEQHFRMLVEQSPVALEIMEPDGRVTQGYAAYMDLWGLSPESLAEIYDKYNFLEDQQAKEMGIMPLIEKAFNGEVVNLPPFEYDAEETLANLGFETKGGRKRWIQARLYPVKNEQGEIITVVNMSEDITEAKLAEQALKESEARFRITFEQAAVGIAHVAPNGRFLRVNQKFCDIVGYTEEQLLISTFQNITHPDDLYADLQKVRSLLEKEAETYTIEKRYIHKQGHIVWIILTVSLLWEESGEPKWFVAVIEEITERKQLQEERDRILNTSLDLICIASLDGYLKYLNPAWGKILGYTETELLSRPFLDFVHPDDHSQTDAEMASLTAGNTTVDFENRYICKDGSIRTISWVATPLLEEQVMYCIGRDITQRRRMQESLRESEAKFRDVIDQSPVSIQIHGLDGKLLKSNPAYAKLYALNEETLKELYEKYNIRADAQAEAIGVAPYIERVYAGEKIRFPSYEYNGIDTLKTLDFENPISRKCWVQTLGFPLINENGNVTSVVFMSEDITEQKQAEQAVAAYQQRLQALAAELTLAEERERRRIAADLHDHVSQSLALARIQLGTARKLESETRRDNILDGVSQTLLEAIQDTRTLIFDLSSPVLNELGLETAVSAWLRDQIDNTSNLETSFHDDGQEKPLAEDVRAILFRNVRELLANVVRHAHATKIEVSLARLGANIQIIIQDNGIGFAPETTTQQVLPQGGFGLFSIQERMTDLGGSLQIESTPNQGATVILTAPLDFSE